MCGIFQRNRTVQHKKKAFIQNDRHRCVAAKLDAEAHRAGCTPRVNVSVTKGSFRPNRSWVSLSRLSAP